MASNIQGISELAFNLYPNPAQDNVTIESQNVLPGTLVQIHNSTGSLLISRQSIGAGEGRLTIELSDHLASGLYFVSVINAEGRAVQKMQITR